MNIPIVFKQYGDFSKHFGSFEIPNSCWALVLRASESGLIGSIPLSELDRSNCLLGHYRFSVAVSRVGVHQQVVEIDQWVVTLGDFENSVSESGTFILWSDEPFAIVLPVDRPVGRNETELHISRRFEAGVFPDESLSLNEVLGLLNIEYQGGKNSLVQFLVSKSQPAMALPTQP